jgi:hypothetical protein
MVDAADTAKVRASLAPRTLGSRQNPMPNARSITTTARPVLAREVHLRVHNSHMPCQCIVAREGLLLNTECTAHLLLASVVDSVLVTSKVVWSREDRVARLARCGVDALTLVRPRLGVAVQDSR